MKTLAVICAMAVVWLGSAGAVHAARPAIAVVPPAVPFAEISVTPDKVELDEAPEPGGFSGSLKAHIVANCPHQVKVSFAPFKPEDGGIGIRPEHTSVAINGTAVPAGGAGVAIVSSPMPTPAGGLDVPVHLQVTVANLWQYAAGTYKGTLSLRVTTGV
jgi:hypothetical protein